MNHRLFASLAVALPQPFGLAMAEPKQLTGPEGTSTFRQFFLDMSSIPSLKPVTSPSWWLHRL